MNNEKLKNLQKEIEDSINYYEKETLKEFKEFYEEILLSKRPINEITIKKEDFEDALGFIRWLRGGLKMLADDTKRFLLETDAWGKEEVMEKYKKLDEILENFRKALNKFAEFYYEIFDTEDIYDPKEDCLPEEITIKIQGEEKYWLEYLYDSFLTLKDELLLLIK